MKVIVVPTIEGAPTRVTIESARAVFARSGIRTIAVCTSERTDSEIPEEPSLKFIDSGAVAALVRGFEQLTDCGLVSLFGRAEYNRSYGGAANLCSAIAVVVGAESYYRFDDDCLFAQTRLVSGAKNAVVFGSYLEREVHPRLRLLEAYPALIDALDPRHSRAWTQRPKTGCLCVSAEAARAAPFPVWFDYETGLMPRGEIYDWERALRPGGVTFEHASDFSVHHLSDYPTDPARWLRSFALKADYSFISNWLASRQRGDLTAELCARRRRILDALGMSHLPFDTRASVEDLVVNHSLRFAMTGVPSFQRARAIWARLMIELADEENRGLFRRRLEI